MLISVIVPVYNGERYLADAIASVWRQTSASLELIIVDDGSTDGTAALVRDLGPKVRVARQINQGPAVARNHGLELATGDLIAFIDADDLWPDDKLRLQLPILLADPAVQMVLGKVQRLWSMEDSAGNRRFELRTPPWGELLLGCGLFRRAVFARIGPFDPTLRTGEDTDWFLRAREVGVATAMLEQVTLFYRRHPDSLTAGIDKDPLFSILQRVLQRQRQARVAPDRQEKDTTL
jgi:glycosyltransferase involved in cell wall biosynthesis